MNTTTARMLLLPLTLTLASCAGLHSIPQQGYSITTDTTPLTTRIAFDQTGTLYPASPSAIMPTSPKIGRNDPFYIKKHMDSEISPKSTEENYQRLAEQIIHNSQKSESKKMIFLIHGYNNSYAEAKQSFEAIKHSIKSFDAPEHSYIEVYWDGLHKGALTFPIPYFYWGDSMSYSNIAGQLGLRHLIDKLPKDSDIVLLTHSRGAGVAFSTFSNPVYDKDINCIDPKSPSEAKIIACRKIDQPQKPDIRRLTIVAIAPAIGNGHTVNGFREHFPSDSKIFIGFNTNDRTLKKFLPFKKIANKYIGDTSLGNNPVFFHQLEKETQLTTGQPWIEKVDYSQKDHSILSYLKDYEKTACLFWASDLTRTQPKNCRLSR